MWYHLWTNPKFLIQLLSILLNPFILTIIAGILFSTFLLSLHLIEKHLKLWVAVVHKWRHEHPYMLIFLNSISSRQAFELRYKKSHGRLIPYVFTFYFSLGEGMNHGFVNLLLVYLSLDTIWTFPLISGTRFNLVTFLKFLPTCISLTIFL